MPHNYVGVNDMWRNEFNGSLVQDWNAAPMDYRHNKRLILYMLGRNDYVIAIHGYGVDSELGCQWTGELHQISDHW